jgi:hypothetical protein
MHLNLLKEFVVLIVCGGKYASVLEIGRFLSQAPQSLSECKVPP